jgi:hypothetical protein
MNQNIVYTNTNLPSILKFGNHTLLGCPIKVCRSVNDLGAFASQLKDTWKNKILGCCLRDELTFGSGSGKADHVKPLLGELDAYVTATLDDSDASLIQVFLNQGLHCGGAIGSKL